MSKSESESESEPFTLSEADVRGVVCLLAEALSPDDGRTAKIGRIMAGLSEVTQADGWLWIRSRFPLDGGKPANIDYTYGGAVGQHSIAAYADWSFEVDGEAEELKVLKPLIAAGRHATHSRTELIPEAVWQDRRCRAHVDRMGLEAFMYSLVPLAEHQGAMVTSGPILFRKIGRPEFDRRAAMLTHLMIQECGSLHTEGLDMQRVDDVAMLTPRQRSVLAMMIEGLNIDRAAGHLRLSPHTVNDHVKAIYRHFDVQSRSELMRRFMSVDRGAQGE